MRPSPVVEEDDASEGFTLGPDQNNDIVAQLGGGEQKGERGAYPPCGTSGV